MTARSVRRIAFKLHTWFGLHIALIFAVLFLTGTLLVFSKEIGLIGQPGVFILGPAADQQASYGKIYDTISASYPDATIISIDKKPEDWLADRVNIRTATGETLALWTDPATVEVVGVSGAQNFHTVMLDIHENLLVPGKIAFLAVTSTSIILMGMVITGIITYRRFWKGLFRFPKAAMDQRNWHATLHRVIAVWLLPFLLITALTGIVFFLNGTNRLGGAPQASPAAARTQLLPAGFNGIRIDEAEEAARAALPGFKPSYFILPRTLQQGVRFGGVEDGSLILNDGSMVGIDPTNLQTLQAFRNSDKHGVAILKSWANSLHFGKWGGIVSRILWLIFGLAGTALLFTGAMIYAGRLAGPAPAATKSTAMGRILNGLGLFKWAYLLLLVGMIALAVREYSPEEPKWANVAGPASSKDMVLLAAKGHLRADTALPLRLTVTDTSVTAATVQANGRPAESLALKGEGVRRSAGFTLNPQREANVVNVVLTGTDGTETEVTYRLGRVIR